MNRKEYDIKYLLGLDFVTVAKELMLAGLPLIFLIFICLIIVFGLKPKDDGIAQEEPKPLQSLILLGP